MDCAAVLFTAQLLYPLEQSLFDTCFGGIIYYAFNTLKKKLVNLVTK